MLVQYVYVLPQIYRSCISGGNRNARTVTSEKKQKISRSCQVRLVLSLTRGGWEDIAATYYEHSSYCTADGSKLAGEGDVGPTYRVILVVSELRWVDFI